ncbi:hypothetical protein ABLA76_09225 [Xenorhabdus sp. SGI240]
MTYPESIVDFTGFIDDLIGRQAIYVFISCGNCRRSQVLWHCFPKESDKHGKLGYLTVELLSPDHAPNA